MKHVLKIVITLYYDQRSSLTLACRKDELDELELDAIGALYKAVGGWLDVWRYAAVFALELHSL